MKHLKRWLALAVSAALALTLLAGCHTGGGISSRLLLDLLAGELENVQVETDSNFDRALKAAVQKGGSDPSAVLDALIEELGISGGAVNFSISGIGNASAGRQSLNVVFQPGTSASTAANNAASGWLGVLRGLAGSGEYSGLVSMVEVNGGYILAISVTVEQPGNIGSDSDDNDTDPGPGPYDVGYSDENYTITGTEEQKTFTVKTAAGLQTWAEYTNDGHLNTNCTLNSSTITLSGEWTPIGTLGNGYTGTFDGNNCTITGLTIDTSSFYVGLLGCIGSGGEVTNLTLKDAAVSGNANVGGVAGFNYGTVIGCKVEGGSVSGSEDVGGVVGLNLGTITACYHANGSVSGNKEVGGVVGANGITINVGVSIVPGTVTACYHANGSVSGSTSVGGVVGFNSVYDGVTPSVPGIITACYWSGYDGPGIGDGKGDTTKVDGTPGKTWADAAGAMNGQISGWEYINGTGTTPLTLKQK